VSFASLAAFVSRAAGSPYAFALAVFVIVAWGASGPVFRYSDTWQLVINTGTTIVTFLMVFLIQNSQNRDTALIKALLQEIAEDLPQVDDRRATRRAEVER
jgi:low affinity Fe/Cu permease